MINKHTQEEHKKNLTSLCVSHDDGVPPSTEEKARRLTQHMAKHVDLNDERKSVVEKAWLTFFNEKERMLKTLLSEFEGVLSASDYKKVEKRMHRKHSR